MKQDGHTMHRDPNRNNNDPELSRLLQAWQVDPRDDPALVAHVWRRIEAAPPPWWREGIGAFSSLLIRPAVATAIVVAFVLAGITVAGLQIRSLENERLVRLAAEYARSIDPILMTNNAGHIATP